ncbi:11218_t:CDS:2, partial [Acaulospora colombiana]
ILRGSSGDSMGGVTQVQFSPDGYYLFSASRRDNNIRCWDIRNSGDVLYSLFRQGDTNQRLTFDIEKSGRFLITGDQVGKILVYDLKNHSEDNTSRLISEMTGHD